MVTHVGDGQPIMWIKTEDQRLVTYGAQINIVGRLANIFPSIPILVDYAYSFVIVGLKNKSHTPKVQ